MKTKFKFLAAMTMAFGLFSCSNDDVLDNSTPKEPGILGNAETYATISIAMPGGDAMGARAISRATDTDPEMGDGTEVGTDSENTFNSVSLYFFDNTTSTATCQGVLDMNATLFDKTEDTENKTVIYTTSEAQKVGIEGTGMAVYAVVNGGIPSVNLGTKLDDFLKKTVVSNVAISKSSSTLNYLLMTSRAPQTLTISSTENNTKEKAAELAINVERTAAKITYKAEKTGNKYDVENDKSGNVGSVTITDYKLVNLRNDAYYFRKVGSADGTWGGQQRQWKPGWK